MKYFYFRGRKFREDKVLRFAEKNISVNSWKFIITYNTRSQEFRGDLFPQNLIPLNVKQKKNTQDYKFLLVTFSFTSV